MVLRKALSRSGKVARRAALALLIALVFALGWSARWSPGFGPYFRVPRVLAQAIFQQSCPSGMGLLQAGWQVYNNSNSQFVQFGCVDTFGNISINGTIYAPQGTTEATLNSAIAELPHTGMHGGVIVIASNQTIALSSTLQLGDSTTTNIVLRPMGRIEFECTMTDGTDCIQVASSSGINCVMTSINNCVVDIAPGAIVNSGIATLPGKTNELLILRNVDVRNWSGSQGGTVNTALWNLTGIFDTQMVGDSCTMGANTIGMEFHDDADGINAPNNVNITGLNCGPAGGASGTGLQDLLIKEDHGVPIGPISVSGADFGAHTNTTIPAIDLESGTGSGLIDINIDNVYGEENPSAAMTAPFFLNNGGDGVRIRDFQINRLFASASGYAVQIENTVSGNPFAGEFSGTITGGTGNNFVQDSINSVNLTDNANGHYFFINGSLTNNNVRIGQSVFTNSTLNINGFLAATNISTTTGTITFTAISANSCQNQTTTVTGATTSMVVIAQPSAALAASHDLDWSARISASNTVEIKVCNVTTGSITPNAVAWNVRVIQ